MADQTRSIREIEAELARARAVEDARLKAVREAVKPERRFTIAPVEDDAFDRIYDPTVKAYKLTGVVVNADECRAVGRSEYELGSGAMRYLFNTGTGRLIGPCGGGTIYFSPPWGRGKERQVEALETVVAGISAFLVARPEGGDVSDLVNAFRARVGHDD